MEFYKAFEFRVVDEFVLGDEAAEGRVPISLVSFDPSHCAQFFAVLPLSGCIDDAGVFIVSLRWFVRRMIEKIPASRLVRSCNCT